MSAPDASIAFLESLSSTKSNLAANVNLRSVFDAEKVRKFAVILTIMNDKICALTLLQRAYFLAAIQTIGSIDGGGRDRLGRRHPQLRRRQR